MDYFEIMKRFIDDLQLAINYNNPEIDRNTVDDIKADVDDAINDIYTKYKLVEPQ
ncbi:MAG TPA: hypothetical protein VEG39_01705 [Clostridia bacterium]|nr:hypothetical protein [Clostridia bacterium]